MTAGDQSPAASSSDNPELDNLQSRDQDMLKEYEEFVRKAKEQQPGALMVEDHAIQKVRRLPAYLHYHT